MSWYFFRVMAPLDYSSNFKVKFCTSVAPIVARRRRSSQHFGWHWLHAKRIGWWDGLDEPAKPGWWLGQALGQCLRETSIVVPRQVSADEDEYLLDPGIGESSHSEPLPNKETLNTNTDYLSFNWSTWRGREPFVRTFLLGCQGTSE